MNYIIISPYYPYNFQKFSQALAQAGARVLGIGQEPYDQLPDQVKSALTEYFRVDNLEDWDQAYRAVAYFYHQYGPIDRLESQNEYWLELDAFLRQEFNIPGLKPEELKKTKLKSAMKEYFQKAGVPVAKWALVESVHEIDQAIEKVGLPLIAKPDNGVGAAATYKLTSLQDLEDFKAVFSPQTVYIFEEFIQGKEVCTYDGYVDGQGQIVFQTSLYYSEPPLTLLVQQLDPSYVIDVKMDAKLQAYGQSIVEAFGMRERFFHIEFFRMESGDYMAIEYNNRPAGGFTMEVYGAAYQIDLYKLYAENVVNQTWSAEEKPRYCLASSRRDSKSYRYSRQEIEAKYGNSLVYVFQMPHAFSSLLGDWQYILTSQDHAQIPAMIEDIQALA